jgi:hypothetical protein
MYNIIRNYEINFSRCTVWIEFDPEYWAIRIHGRSQQRRWNQGKSSLLSSSYWRIAFNCSTDVLTSFEWSSPSARPRVCRRPRHSHPRRYSTEQSRCLWFRCTFG